MEQTPLLVQVDAFTDKPFSGNPAAVCLLSEPADAAWMQAVGVEMNLSETAFVWPLQDGFSLRWFTPAVEVNLCGHATLATAHVLWQEGWLAESAVARFHTRSGLLTATQEYGRIVLDFPATPAKPADPPKGMLAALGIDAAEIFFNGVDYLVHVPEEADVRGLQPDFPALRRVGMRGATVTAASDRPEFDFVSRFFAPGAGIDEDPVTGSAHCTLGPFWAKRLGKSSLQAFQASARGGVLKVSLQGDRVLLAGQAVTVLKGSLLTAPTLAD